MSWGSVGVQITTARGKKAESPRQMPPSHSCLVPLAVRAALSGLTTETTGQCNLKDRSPKKIREVSWRQMEWDVRVDVTGYGAPSKVRAYSWKWPFGAKLNGQVCAGALATVGVDS